MRGCTEKPADGYEIVVIGTSLGGLQALRTILSELPADFRLPVAVVQHRRADSEDRLESLLQGWCRLPVRVTDDKDPILPGHIQIAPPGYHLLIGRGELSLSTEAPVLNARPSIDVLFETAAESYGPGVLGVLLTGASADGANGLSRIKQLGGCALVQNPATAEASVMPNAALRIMEADHVLELSEITPCIVERCRRSLRVRATGAVS